MWKSTQAAGSVMGCPVWGAAASTAALRQSETKQKASRAPLARCVEAEAHRAGQQAARSWPAMPAALVPTPPQHGRKIWTRRACLGHVLDGVQPCTTRRDRACARRMTINMRENKTAVPPFDAGMSSSSTTCRCGASLGRRRRRRRTTRTSTSTPTRPSTSTTTRTGCVAEVNYTVQLLICTSP